MPLCHPGALALGPLGLSDTATGNGRFLPGLQQHIGEHEAHESHEDDSLEQDCWLKSRKAYWFAEALDLR